MGSYFKRGQQGEIAACQSRAQESAHQGRKKRTTGCSGHKENEAGGHVPPRIKLKPKAVQGALLCRLAVHGGQAGIGLLQFCKGVGVRQRLLDELLPFQLAKGGLFCCHTMVKCTHTDGGHATVDHCAPQVVLEPNRKVSVWLCLEVRNERNEKQQAEVDERPGCNGHFEGNTASNTQPDSPPQRNAQCGKKPNAPRGGPHVSRSWR